MDNKIFEIVKKITKEQLGVLDNQINPEAKFKDDLGADSLDVLEVTMALEEEFGIEISDEDLVDVATVRQIVDYISRQVAQKVVMTNPKESKESSIANFQI